LIACPPLQNERHSFLSGHASPRNVDGDGGFARPASPPSLYLGLAKSFRDYGVRLRNALGHPFFQQRFGVSRPVPDINELRAPTDATKLRKRLGFNLYAPSLKKVGGFNVGEKGTVRQHLTITPLVGRTGAISGVPQNFQVLTFGETLFRAFSRRVRMGLDLPSNFELGGIGRNSRRRVYRFDSSRRGRAGEPRVGPTRGDEEPR
jgi:hypothetical protein